MSVAFDALAKMHALVNVDFTNNKNMKGTWLGNTTYSTQVTHPTMACNACMFMACELGSGLASSSGWCRFKLGLRFYTATTFWSRHAAC